MVGRPAVDQLVQKRLTSHVVFCYPIGMQPKALKHTVAKIRQNCPDKDQPGGFLNLRQVADRCAELGMSALNLSWWRSVASSGSFPSVLFGGKWHVRRDYVDELFRQLAHGAA